MKRSKINKFCQEILEELEDEILKAYRDAQLFGVGKIYLRGNKWTKKSSKRKSKKLKKN